MFVKVVSKTADSKEIVDYFMNKYSHSTDEADKIDIMFRFIQYIERQIVLFDAVEDAAFPINNMEGRGSLGISKKSRCKGKKN
jgi:phosphoenolpyruvate carboxylase